MARLSYVRNSVNLSARELSLRIGMSDQYISQVESGRISLSIKKLLMILKTCNFSINRFFSEDYKSDVDSELDKTIKNLSPEKKKFLMGLLSGDRF